MSVGSVSGIYILYTSKLSQEYSYILGENMKLKIQIFIKKIVLKRNIKS